MYELSVALRYLVPRRRQLSVSIIALISTLVIALVVWLIVVFLSVTEGIEKRWLGNLVNLNAPIRLTPTDAYYDSYYYQVDAHSGEAGYGYRTIAEKLAAGASDAYDPELDAELPMGFALPDLRGDGSMKDPVQDLFAAVGGMRGVEARDFEMGLGNLRIRLLRGRRGHPDEPLQYVQSFVSQVSYLSAFDADNAHVARTILPPAPRDLSHALQAMAFTADAAREESPSGDVPVALDALQSRLGAFFANVKVSEMETAKEGWRMPTALYPSGGRLRGTAVKQGSLVTEVRLGEGGDVDVVFTRGGFEIEGAEMAPGCRLVVEGGVPMVGHLSSLDGIHTVEELKFDVELQLQGVKFAGEVPYQGLVIADAEIRDRFQASPEATPLWVHGVGEQQRLPKDAEGCHGILVAKSFRESDVHIGDRGYVSYYAGTPSSVQEQRVPVYVAGFYDPGLLPIGSKMVLVPREITNDVQGALTQAERGQANGVGLWFDDLKSVDAVKEQVERELDERGILPYWKIESYKEYDFARPLVQQFQSDRNLFFLIAGIVIVVACSNIISMLLLLVNDKRREIGILQSMGATRGSIAFIFATCGTVMATFGSLLGIGAAFLTLRNLDVLVRLMSQLQGHEAFQTMFFGDSLPNQLSTTVLSFVVGATIVVSLVAGLIPAIKATRVRPSEILRSQ